MSNLNPNVAGAAGVSGELSDCSSEDEFLPEESNKLTTGITIDRNELARLKEELKREKARADGLEAKYKETRSQLAVNYLTLKNDVEGRLPPTIQDKGKHHVFILFKFMGTSRDCVWHMKRTTIAGMLRVKQKMFQKSYLDVGKWENVPNAVDIGTVLRENAYKRGYSVNRNHIISPSGSDEELVGIINNALVANKNVSDLAAANLDLWNKDK